MRNILKLKQLEVETRTLTEIIAEKSKSNEGSGASVSIDDANKLKRLIDESAKIQSEIDVNSDPETMMLVTQTREQNDKKLQLMITDFWKDNFADVDSIRSLIETGEIQNSCNQVYGEKVDCALFTNIIKNAGEKFKELDTWNSKSINFELSMTEDEKIDFFNTVPLYQLYRDPNYPVNLDKFGFLLKRITRSDFKQPLIGTGMYCTYQMGKKPKECELITKLSTTCFYALIFEDELTDKKSEVQIMISSQNPCTNEDCLTDEEKQLVTTKLKPCVGKIPDVQIDLPVKHNYLDSTVMKMTLGTQGSCSANIIWRTYQLCYETNCEISYDLTIMGMSVKFSTDGPAKVVIHFVDTEFVMFIRSAGQSSKVFPMPSFGQVRFKVMCGRSSLEKLLVFTKREWCALSTGWLKNLMYAYCMNAKAFYITGACLISLLLFIIMRKILIPLYAYFFMIFVAFPYKLITTCIFKFCNKFCANCGKSWLFGAKKAHICPAICSLCCENINDKNKEMKVDNHTIVCKVFNERKRFDGIYEKVYTSIKPITKLIAEPSYTVTCLILAIVIIFNISSVESSSVDRVETNFKELYNLGFRQFEGRFLGSDFERKTVAIISRDDKCLENCKASVHIMAKLKLMAGFEAGFVLKDKDTNQNLDMRVKETYIKLDIRFLYRTCKSTIKSETSDTCTDGCDVCVQSFLNLNKSNHIVRNSGTSSWACDGPGCMSINSGCTCGSCWMDPIVSECSDVYKVSAQDQFVELCISIQNTGMCKNISSVESIASAEFGFISSTAGNFYDPETKFVIDKGNFILSGQINDKGEYSMKFGSIQWSGYDNWLNEKADCVPSPLTREICHFATHRSIEFTRCCPDTYDFKKDLRALPNHFLVKEASKTTIIVKSENLGSADVKMVLKDVFVEIKISKLSLSKFRINSCIGCYKCDQGLIITIEVESDLEGAVTMKSEGFSVKQNTLKISKGKTATSVYGSADVKEPSIKLILKDNTVAVFKCTLDEKLTSYHSVDATDVRMSQKEGQLCDTTICTFGVTISKMWTWLTSSYLLYIVITVIVIIVIVVITLIIIKFVKFRKYVDESGKFMPGLYMKDVYERQYEEEERALGSESDYNKPRDQKLIYSRDYPTYTPTYDEGLDYKEISRQRKYLQEANAINERRKNLHKKGK